MPTLEQLFASETRWLNGEVPSKNPVDPNTGEQGRNNDPSTFGTHAQAVTACNGRAKLYLGVVPLEPLVIFDLDAARDPETGEIAPFALDIIAKVNSHTEISPSGTGLHIFALCPGCTVASTNIKWPDPKGGKKKQGIEVMVGLGHYCTVTNAFVGDLRDVATVSQVTIQDIIALAYDEQGRHVGDDFRREARKHRPYTKGTTDIETYRAWALAMANGEHLDHNDWFRRGYALFAAFGDTQEAADLWDQFSKQGGKKYNRRNTVRCWRSICRTGAKGITAGSLYYYATHESGTWEPPPKRAEPPRSDAEPDGDPVEHAAASRRKQRAKRAKPHGSAPSNIVELPGDMDANAKQAFAALIAQDEVYRRGRILVVPDASVILDTRRGKRQHAAMVPIGVPLLMKFLDEATTFLKFDKKTEKLVPAFPSKRLCEVLIEFVSDQPTGLPVLDGVMRMPFLRRDGSICTEPGYDESSSIFCHFTTQEASS